MILVKSCFNLCNLLVILAVTSDTGLMSSVDNKVTMRAEGCLYSGSGGVQASSLSSPLTSCREFLNELSSHKAVVRILL